mmetsp:Transcript_119356/g.382554  ORF Transcript_119356/g.382554 Transcript_119356/m.382554 type:complete len:223 (+) Transcript_119356:224-892(+)
MPGWLGKPQAKALLEDAPLAQSPSRRSGRPRLQAQHARPALRKQPVHLGRMTKNSSWSCRCFESIPHCHERLVEHARINSPLASRCMPYAISSWTTPPSTSSASAAWVASSSGSGLRIRGACSPASPATGSAGGIEIRSIPCSSSSSLALSSAASASSLSMAPLSSRRSILRYSLHCRSLATRRTRSWRLQDGRGCRASSRSTHLERFNIGGQKALTAFQSI